MARRRVRGAEQWRQLRLPGLEEQLEHVASVARVQALGAAPGCGGGHGGHTRGHTRGQAAAGGDWEVVCFRAACQVACGWAVETLTDLEAQLHAQRPAGYVVEGWRARTLVTRFGDVRVQRRLYRAPDGTAHFLLDEHLGWPKGQGATPAFAALLVDWATDVPFRTAARRVAEATAGVVGGSTVWRLLQAVAQRVVAHEAATHTAWKTTAALPTPTGERVVLLLCIEADGVWVKTQREPAHREGLELKCASMYEGWEQLAGPTPGHPRAHYRLVEKQVYCHGFARADAQAPVPFWDGVDLALARTYDLSRVPVVVIGGDGANWIDTALEHFPQGVRQRDGFHLARDAARGWGPLAGATLYQAVRTGDQATRAALLALPPPYAAAPRGATCSRAHGAALPASSDAATKAVTDAVAPPLALATGGAAAPPTTVSTGSTWSVTQVQRARATFAAQVRAADAAVDWRLQVAPDQVPPAARGLGTQEGTNAHLLAKRMKHKGMAWSARGARHLAKTRQVLTNGGAATLIQWCHRPATDPLTTHPTRPSSTGRAAPGPPPWPQVACPTAHGPLSDSTAAILHRINTGARFSHRLF